MPRQEVVFRAATSRGFDLIKCPAAVCGDEVAPPERPWRRRASSEVIRGIRVVSAPCRERSFGTTSSPNRRGASRTADRQPRHREFGWLAAGTHEEPGPRRTQAGPAKGRIWVNHTTWLAPSEKWVRCPPPRARTEAAAVSARAQSACYDTGMTAAGPAGSSTPPRDPGPPRSPGDWLRLGAIALELVLLYLVVDRYQVWSQALSGLLILTLVGFLVHVLLPLRLRLAWFALLSMGAVVLVLGPEHAKWVLGIGLGLIGLCHLPLPARVIAWLALGAGAVLAAMRGGLVEAPWPPVVWPVLGAMFMFRLGMFLHDRAQGAKPRSIWETLGYFFLLPNVLFTLFPVVDYRAFQKSWYAEDQWACAQKGVRWIVRGIVHLIVYRFIYYYGVIAPSEVASLPLLIQYLVTNFGLYLRVSGIFHLAVGILRLFGFALPETHFLYFLSASVNDFWRRANIYWKDFMLKFFYLPLFFRWRKQGEGKALVKATVIVVLITWALHSYQWFWLRGSFPLRWQDAAFWALLGGCMIWNTTAENRSKGARGRRARSWTVQNSIGQAGKILATYTFLCVIWSLWACESWAGWVAMMTLQGDARGVQGLVRPSLVIAPVIAVVALTEGASTRIASVPRSALLTSVGLAALVGLSFPRVYTSFGERTTDVVQSLRIVRLNRLDAASLQRGYYEDLLDVADFNSELARVMSAKPAGWAQLHETVAMRSTGDWRLTELAPDTELPYKGALMKTNSRGMRDREYALEPQEGTYRIAMLGASYVMGSGVENDETFEAVLERELNDELPIEGVRAFELLNFSVGGYSPLQRTATLELAALAFSPDTAIYIAHENEPFRIARYLTSARALGAELPVQLAAIVESAEMPADVGIDAFEVGLEPVVDEALAWAYGRFVELCRGNGVRPVWVFLPTLEMHGVPSEIAWLPEMAREAGFEVIELFGVYGGEDLFSLRIADWDYHPNVRGHQLIAERLFAELAARPELFRRDE